MPEITNKLTYQDFYSTSSSSSPNIMDNAVSILRNICDYLSDFNNITVSFWQNSTESDLLDTATLSIKKYGYDSFYMITITTVGEKNGFGSFKVELINGTGLTSQLYENSYSATTWSSYCFRLYYFSTSKLFLFNIFISNSATIPTAPREGTTGTMLFVKDKNNNSYYIRTYSSSSSSIYKDDLSHATISSPSSKNNDVNKAVLCNIYINSYALDGLYILTTSSSCSVNYNYYCELNGYGKYYVFYNSSFNRGFAIKLDEE